MIMDISGQTCYVNASYINGKIEGEVSHFFSGRKMNFQFEPLKSLSKKQMLFLELKRLYLEYKKVAADKHQIQLGVLGEEELPKNDFNLLDTRMFYLGQIQGSPKHYVTLNLRKLKKKFSEDELAVIDEYKARTGYPPPIQYDTLEVTVVISADEQITTEIDLEQYQYLREDKSDMFCFLPLKRVAEEICKTTVLAQSKESGGLYQLLFKKDIPSL